MLKGLDLYHGDTVSSWQKIKDHFDFVFLKASDGVSYNDPKFVEYFNAAKHLGLVVGAYHFMEWQTGSGRLQAHNFYKALQKAGYNKDLPPVCDWEYHTGVDPKKADLVVGKEFLDEISQLTGRHPIIYTNHSIPIELVSPSWLSDYPLWIASYNPSPRVPKPWSNWTFWQSEDNAVLPGVHNKGDLDFYQGTVEDLLKL